MRDTCATCEMHHVCTKYGCVRPQPGDVVVQVTAPHLCARARLSAERRRLVALGMNRWQYEKRKGEA